MVQASRDAEQSDEGPESIVIASWGRDKRDGALMRVVSETVVSVG